MTYVKVCGISSLEDTLVVWGHCDAQRKVV